MTPPPSPKVWTHSESGLYLVELPGEQQSPGNCSAGGHSIKAHTHYVVIEEKPGTDLLPQPVKILFCGKLHVIEWLRLRAENTKNDVYQHAANWFRDNLPDNV